MLADTIINPFKCIVFISPYSKGLKQLVSCSHVTNEELKLEEGSNLSISHRAGRQQRQALNPGAIVVKLYLLLYLTPRLCHLPSAVSSKPHLSSL